MNKFRHISPAMMLSATSLRPKIAGMLLVIIIIWSATASGAHWFESSMSRHMLIQLPLLIALGFAFFQPRASTHAALMKTDSLGAIAFISITGWMLFWMLPINLDLATSDPWIRLLKLVSLPIGIGFCIRWFWNRANAILKCVLVFEIWASITRLGWLYIESPLQLCTSYLIGEQQVVGYMLLIISAISALLIVTYSLFGTFDKITTQYCSNQ